MKKIKKIAILTTVVSVIVIVLLFNPFISFRVYQEASCSTFNMPSHIVMVQQSFLGNLTGCTVFTEGYYTVCMSHPDEKAYGMMSRYCLADNGTHVLIGHDLSDSVWNKKTDYSGIVIFNWIIPSVSTNTSIIGIVLAVLSIIMIVCLLSVGQPDDKKLINKNKQISDYTPCEHEHVTMPAPLQKPRATNNDVAGSPV